MRGGGGGGEGGRKGREEEVGGKTKKERDLFLIISFRTFESEGVSFREVLYSVYFTQ